MTITEFASLGGKARIANMGDGELAEFTSRGARARWKKYYRENPEKLQARKDREKAKKARERKRRAKAGA
jgi:hypothetical protein